MSKSADAFRTISEVADWLGVQTHVLRFWESKFTQIKPVKRAGGRRYYRPADMLLLGGIRKLLHDDGMTIKGVQKLLREEGMAYVSDMSAPLDDETAAQVDETLGSEADLVEAELAPISDEDTVTPFVPKPKAEPEEVTDARVETPARSQADPDAAIAASEEPVAAKPDEISPEPEPDPVVGDTSEVESEAAEEPQDAAAAEPAPATEDPQRAPSGPAGDETSGAPRPVFARTPDPAPPVPSTDLIDDDAPAELPAFLTGRRAQVDPAPADGPQDAAPTPAIPKPPKPKPRIVDVPDEPDPAMMTVAPSALTRATQTRALRPEQRTALRPLLTQLTALRDQMAAANRDAR